MDKINIDSLTIKEIGELAEKYVELNASYERLLYQVEKLTEAASAKNGSCMVPNPSLIPVIICTDKQAVVFGYTTNTSGDKITLERARMCLYWSVDVGGVFGLAEKGPTRNCKISTIAPSVTLTGITAIFSVDDAAVKAWTEAPIQGR